jgi:benzylsuccinate CoA-transferase BbsF subunit
VLQKWSVGYDEQCKIKPDIVYVSMSGHGHTGRNHHYTRFGPVAPSISGLTYLSASPEKPLAGWGWSYMVDTAGMYGAMCASLTVAFLTAGLLVVGVITWGLVPRVRERSI